MASHDASWRRPDEVMPDRCQGVPVRRCAGPWRGRDRRERRGGRSPRGPPPVDEPRPRPGERGVRVNRPDRYAVGQLPLGHQGLRQIGSVLEVVAAGRGDDDLGPAAEGLVPRHPHRLLARRAHDVGPAGPGDHLRHPVTGREGRVGPLEHEGPRSRATGDRRLHGIQSPLLEFDETARTCLVPGRRTEGQHGGEHLVDGVRVDRQDVRTAAEVKKRLVDDGDVDCADRTQVLGDDEVGVEVRQSARIEVVEVFPGVHPLRDGAVDLGRSEAFRQGGRGDDAAGPGLGGVVALERHADDVVAGTDRKEDLGARGQEGHDPHAHDHR